jgi:hypothetical protein
MSSKPHRHACEKGNLMASLRVFVFGFVMLTALAAGCSTTRTSRTDSQPSYTPLSSDDPLLERPR